VGITRTTSAESWVRIPLDKISIPLDKISRFHHNLESLPDDQAAWKHQGLAQEYKNTLGTPPSAEVEDGRDDIPERPS